MSEATENDYCEPLRAWTSVANEILRELFLATGKRFNEQNFPDPNEGLPLWQLQLSCHTTTESTLLLVRNGRLWDADVLVRSAMEGSFKFAFLLVGDEQQRREKLVEFNVVLFALGRLRHHTRLEEMMKAVSDPDSPEWRPFRDLIMKPGEADAIRGKYPRSTRQAVEQRWSFGEICAALRRSQSPGLANLAHMMFSYGMCSHIAHQDSVGTSIIWDRITRSEERRAAVELAHGARLISDVCAFAQLRTIMLFRRCGEDVAPIKPLMDNLSALEKEMRRAHLEFDEVEYGLPSQAGPAGGRG